MLFIRLLSCSRCLIATYTHFFFFLSLRPPPTSPLFPYTTLFRSVASPNTAQALLFCESARKVAFVLVASGLAGSTSGVRSEEHTSELQSRRDLVCRLLLEKKKKKLTTSPAQ